MKKQKKLQLNKQTIRNLTDRGLRRAAGGTAIPPQSYQYVSECGSCNTCEIKDCCDTLDPLRTTKTVGGGGGGGVGKMGPWSSPSICDGHC